MAGRGHELVRGISALAGLVGAVVGIPAVLVATGEGLPSSVPSGRAAGRWLGHPMSDASLVRGIALLCWFIWALFVVAVIVEVGRRLAQATSGAGRAADAAGGEMAADRRDRPRRRLGVPGLQGLAGACVVAALLLLPHRAPRVRSSGRTVAPIAVTLARIEPASGAVQPAGPVLARASNEHVPPLSGWSHYVVRRYDSLWSIAERQLGDGSRWRELRDSAGRPLTSPVEARGQHHGPPSSAGAGGPGRPEGIGRPRMLQPGEVLLLPVAQPEAGHPATLHRAGSDLSRGVAGRIDPRPTPVETVAHAAGGTAVSRPPAGAKVPAGSAPADPAATSAAPRAASPHLAAPLSQPEPAVAPSPAEALSLAQAPSPAEAPSPPAAEASAPPAVASAAATSSALAAAEGAGETAPLPIAPSAPASPSHHGRRPSSAGLPVTLLEVGLLGAGVMSLVEALRRVQRQHRPVGRRIPLPAGAQADAELALRLGRQPDRVERVAAALHTLGALGPGQRPPAILGVVVSDDAVELLLAEPTPPPAPWVVAAEGYRWRLPHKGRRLVEVPASEVVPALAPVGRAAGSGAEVLVNLEAAGVLAVVGSPARAAGLIRTMAVGLSTLPWAEASNIVLIGFGSELAATPRVRTVSAVADILPELRSTAAVMGELLATHGCGSTLDARLSGAAGDGWPPTLVLCGAPLSDTEIHDLVSLALPGAGVAAVIPAANQPAVGWAIDADGTPMSIRPLRLAVNPSVLSAEDLAAVGDLVDVAADDTGVDANEPPYDRLEISVERPLDPGCPGPPIPPGSSAPYPQVLVRVLGTVEIDGAAAFKRAKSRELAVYLAMHPDGVGEAEMDEALWPSDRGRVVAASTRDSTVSVARTALGGPSRLRPAQGQGREKRYQVGPEVGSDFAVFCALHQEGRRAEAVEPLCAALQLIRGRPFEGVLSGRTFTWVHTEGHARHIESEVGDAADLTATLLLAAGRPLEARWAARRGLAADPLCERLWVRLMEAADDLGESQEIERLMDELDSALELGGDFSGLHPNTLAAYERHRRRPRRV